MQIHYEGKWERGCAGALEIETILGPVKWHQDVRRVPFGSKKIEISKLIRNQQDTVRYIKERSGTKKQQPERLERRGPC